MPEDKAEKNDYIFEIKGFGASRASNNRFGYNSQPETWTGLSYDQLTKMEYLYGIWVRQQLVAMGRKEHELPPLQAPEGA